MAEPHTGLRSHFEGLYGHFVTEKPLKVLRQPDLRERPRLSESDCHGNRLFVVRVVILHREHQAFFHRFKALECGARTQCRHTFTAVDEDDVSVEFADILGADLVFCA